MDRTFHVLVYSCWPSGNVCWPSSIDMFSHCDKNEMIMIYYSKDAVCHTSVKEHFVALPSCGKLRPCIWRAQS